MKRRWLNVLIALGAGLALVGFAALLVRVSELDDFYAACFWLGVVTAGLALRRARDTPIRTLPRPKQSGRPKAPA